MKTKTSTSTSTYRITRGRFGTYTLHYRGKRHEGFSLKRDALEWLRRLGG